MDKFLYLIDRIDTFAVNFIFCVLVAVYFAVQVLSRKGERPIDM